MQSTVRVSLVYLLQATFLSIVWVTATTPSGMYTYKFLINCVANDFPNTLPPYGAGIYKKILRLI